MTMFLFPLVLAGPDNQIANVGPPSPLGRLTNARPMGAGCSKSLSPP